jgi:hypothetical protein
VLTLPQVSSQLRPDRNVWPESSVIAEESAGRLFVASSVSDGNEFSDSTYEFDSINPLESGIPTWRSPRVAYFPYPGDSGFPNYFESQQTRGGKALLSVHLESSLGEEHPGYVEFARVKPLSPTLSGSGVWGQRLKNFAPESAAWSQDGKSLLVCGAVLENGVPKRLAVRRLAM